MLDSRRGILDALREGPALFAGLPGDEVDLDRLMAHLASRRFVGGLYVSDPLGEGVLWIRDGQPDEAWFFEVEGHEAVLSAADAQDLLRDIADRNGSVTVLAGVPDTEPPVTLSSSEAVPPFVTSTAPATHHSLDLPPPAPVARAAPAVVEPAVVEPVVVEPPSPAVVAVADDALAPVPDEPSAHPWASILPELIARVARHRGPRLAGLFMAALDRSLAAHGGHLEDGRVVAPPLSESTWRAVVEEACAPVVSIAGRAFVDRTIVAVERAIFEVGPQNGADT
jgi:hypothetical protein